MPPDEVAPNTPHSSQRIDRVRLAWGATLVVLLAVTWPLWTPLRMTPRVSIASWLAVVPPGLDFVWLVAIAGGVAQAIRRRAARPTLMAMGALVFLMASDQLRWQPWAYHALLVGTVLAFCRASAGMKWLRALTISVYAYSAIAKLDATFAETLGQQFLAALLGGVGVAIDGWPERMRETLALAPVAGELLIAALLAASIRWPSLRKPACCLAVAMHAVTIAVLGPWSLGHSWGVLLWNAGFAWQTVALFWPDGKEIAATVTRSAPAPPAEWFAVGLVTVALVAPLASPWGGWDRWPSWGLYAPGGERAAVFVHEGVVDRLPPALQGFVEATGAEASDPWRRLRLGRWALAENLAPIYPQNRVRLALAAALAERYPLGDRVRIVVEGHADRFTGERASQTLAGSEAIRGAARWFGQPSGVAWTE